MQDLDLQQCSRPAALPDFIGRLARLERLNLTQGRALGRCAAFDTRFSDASKFCTDTLVPSVTVSMNNRAEVKKAGDTLVHQLKFHLGDAEEQETPEIDTSRYQIAFPELPEKGLCDVSPLDTDEWVPTVDCGSPAPYVAPDVPTA